MSTRRIVLLVLLLVITGIPTVLFLRSIAHILWFMATHPADSYRISVTVLSITEENGSAIHSGIAIPFWDIVSGMSLPVFLLSLLLLNRERSARRRNETAQSMDYGA